jgi:hypothetical protein
MCEQVLEAKLFIGHRDAASGHQRKVMENGECNLTDFNALIKCHSSVETSSLKELYRLRQ